MFSSLRMKVICASVALLAFASTAHGIKPLKEASDTTKAKLAKLQVDLTGGLFTFGTLDGEIEGFQQAASKGKDENNRIEDMKDSIGDETFDLINDQLSGMGRKGMEKQRTENMDGSEEAIITRTQPFAIDKTAVSVDQFRRFVKDTGYSTEAEKFGWSFVHEMLLSKDTIKIVDGKEGMGRVKSAPHWCGVEGVYWRRPEGPDSTIKGRGAEPVVQVSWNDGEAYCKWAGLRLPSEKEWEYAARGGLEDEKFPWGEEPDDGDMSGYCNSWEGKFPKENTKKDGYVGVAPVDAYQANGYGLYNMVGNVWEWTADGTKQEKVLRGGSYVDTLDGSANHLLRVSTRMVNSPDSGGANTGFRCARTLEKKARTQKKKAQKKKAPTRRRSDEL